MIYIGLETAMLGGAIFWIVNDRRRAERARARMHAAELERIAAEKRSVESDLQALQARVEPQFLFNTLAHVKHLYEQDPAPAERMLDDLIAYLRAAMPRMRDTSSTVGQEIELVSAYLAIVALRLSDRLTYEIDSRSDVRGARMPPMMLLPLVDHAIRYGLAEPRTRLALRLRTDMVDKVVRIEIAHSGLAFAPDADAEGIAGVRERLAALYGGNASLHLYERPPETSEAVLEFPRADTFPVDAVAKASVPFPDRPAMTGAVS